MTQSSFLLWLLWALFAAAVVLVVGTRYLRVVLAAPLVAASPPHAGIPWLFCEDGSPLDKRVGWFRLRDGGATVIGHQPRAATERAAYVYLTAHDLRDQQVQIRFDPAQRRYVLEHLDGRVLHNNELLPVGASVSLTDGDTVDLGDVTRLRFTFSGPPEVKG
jgi:hypothetical protein